SISLVRSPLRNVIEPAHHARESPAAPPRYHGGLQPTLPPRDQDGTKDFRGGTKQREMEDTPDCACRFLRVLRAAVRATPSRILAARPKIASSVSPRGHATSPPAYRKLIIENCKLT